MTLTRYTLHWFCCEHSCKETPNSFPIFAVDFRVWSEKDETKKNCMVVRFSQKASYKCHMCVQPVIIYEDGSFF